MIARIGDGAVSVLGDTSKLTVTVGGGGGAPPQAPVSMKWGYG